MKASGDGDVVKKGTRELPVLTFTTATAFRDWLAEQPADSPGLWLKLAKKASGIQSVSQKKAIDAALCDGWIDGQLDTFDADYWLIRFTPRRARSKWSEINRTRAQELMAAGQMTARGRSEVERAKADGRWDAAYAPQSTATMPDDLKEALDQNKAASALFADLDSQNRYAILHRIQDAKKPETRATRIEKYVAMLENGETIYPRK